MPRGLIQEAFVQHSELVVWTESLAISQKHDSCAICHEAFDAAVPDICRVLECQHIFHAKCVDLWFIKATFCPMCKNDLKLTHSYKHTSSQRSLGRSSHDSSHYSLGSRSQSSLRSGQLIVGQSNSDPALLRILQEHPIGLFHRTPPVTPDRHHESAPNLSTLVVSSSDPALAVSRSDFGLHPDIPEHSPSSSILLPSVQEVSDEARAADESPWPVLCVGPAPAHARLDERLVQERGLNHVCSEAVAQAIAFSGSSRATPVSSVRIEAAPSLHPCPSPPAHLPQASAGGAPPVVPWLAPYALMPPQMAHPVVRRTVLPPTVIVRTVYRS